jgi:hypothetical protein
MQTKMIQARVIVMVIFFMQPWPAFSSGASNNPDDLFFILSKGPMPATVTTQLPKKIDHQFMRLPDRSTAELSANAAHGGKTYKSGTHASSVHHAQNNVIDSSAEPHTFLKFKPTNILGTVKLPRVKFSSFSPAIDLREETPSLDFTAKSLKDGGF